MSNFGFDYSSNNAMGGDNGGGGFGSQQSPGGARQRRDYGEQTLVPVTVRMVLNAAKNAEGNVALTDGRELHQVKIVGAVRGFEEASTKVVFQVEDGTGLIDVNKWIDETDSLASAQMRQEASQDHIYVRVIGQVKEYDNRKSIVAYNIRKLESCNELTYHMLETVYSAEKYKKGQSIVSSGAPVTYSSHSTAGVGFNSGPSAKPSMGMAPAMGGGMGGGGNNLQQMVLDYIRINGDKSDEGCNINQCISSITGHSESEIRRAVTMLAAEGEIYSTINEDTFKTAQ
eukprot:CAMPEP_0183302654 /NCGR_PEP_ID=MMETSP0160_2-20130417/8366_1 /TAXON_ID=2839 ORGANISM="Odontella Sinensis, Strain Grunow 1884" /NCGR_SAMPLE_ID=MMETSP0160_2 /ASSEMBLY_ACC=CAM_ASM_000250 /LENGTH=285 /DNA_ID=CAMNT_0025465455 /DNA_START=169 /DNA_END=1026 /DNA_ORIENTATION=-